MSGIIEGISDSITLLDSYKLNLRVSQFNVLYLASNEVIAKLPYTANFIRPIPIKLFSKVRLHYLTNLFRSNAHSIICNVKSSALFLPRILLETGTNSVSKNIKKNTEKSWTTKWRLLHFVIQNSSVLCLDNEETWHTIIGPLPPYVFLSPPSMVA